MSRGFGETGLDSRRVEAAAEFDVHVNLLVDVFGFKQHVSDSLFTAHQVIVERPEHAPDAA
jgi:hypothetical protein